MRELPHNLDYKSPQVEIVGCAAEQGFAASRYTNDWYNSDTPTINEETSWF